MKRIHSILLTVLAISGLTSSHALATVYLQNNYGKPIQFVQEPATIAHAFQETTLGNGASANLKPLINVRDYFNPVKQHLSIRTVGGRYTDISYVLNRIANEQSNHPGKDAVIMIDPSYGIYGWNIRIEWGR